MNRDKTYNAVNGRPPSGEMGDLHMFVMPPLLWRDHLHSAIHHIISETISAGFLSLSPDTTLHELRDYVSDQMGYEVVPRDYVYLKCVGRVFTKVRSNQEHHLRVRNFPSPQGGYEIMVLDSILANASGSSSVRSDSRNYDLNNYKPIPPIGSPYTDSKATQTAGGTRSHTNNPPVRESYPQSRNDSYNNNHNSYLSRVGPGSTQPYDSSSLIVSSADSMGSRSIALQTSPPTSRRVGDTGPELSNSKACQTRPPNGEPPQDYNHTRAKKCEEKTKASPSHPTDSRQFNRFRDSGPHTDEPPLPPLSASPPVSPRDTHSQTGDREYLPPLSATPPHTADAAANRPRPSQRPAKYTNHTDSAFSDGLDENERRRLEELRRLEEERRRRFEEEERRRRLEEEEEERRRREEERRRWEEQQRWEEERRRRDTDDDEERRRREEEERRRQEEEERRRREEEERRRRERDGEDDEERRRREEEERRRREEEERRRREEEERRRREEEERRRREEEEEERRRREAERTPSPPPINKDAEKERLREEIERLRAERQELERKREELVKRCKVLQGKTHSRRNQARDVWKKRYFEEKKKTPPLEDKTNKLRQEMDNLHRRIMSQLEGSKDPKDRRGGAAVKPSEQGNLKIQATRTNHEIEDLKRKVENVKIKLTSEMKLRNQAETELRSLRADLTQKKIDVTLQRSQQIGAMTGINGVNSDQYTGRSSPSHGTPRS